MASTTTQAPLEAWTPATLDALDWSDLTPSHPEPRADVTHDEGFFSSWDGARLLWQSWQSQSPRGRVLLMHGYGEHSGRYEHVAVALARAGYDVMAIDARGHGRSEGPRGHVARYDDYVSDLDAARAQLVGRWGESHGPLFVLGHSNGGLITLRYALRAPKDVRAFVVTSPLCGIAVKVPAWKSTAGRLMSKVWPTLSLPTDLPPEYVSHDEGVVAAYKADPLVHGVSTARWFTEVQQACADLYARAGNISQPVLALLAGDDKLVDAAQGQRVMARITSPSSEHDLFETRYHELLNEPEWQDTLRRIILWMEQRRLEA